MVRCGIYFVAEKTELPNSLDVARDREIVFWLPQLGVTCWHDIY